MMRVFLFFTSVVLLFAQNIERNSMQLPEITEALSVLDAATGWTYTNASQWVSANNRIPYRNDKSNEYTFNEYKIGKENFEKYELRNVSIDGNSYSLLLHYYSAGRYKYRNIYEGWYDFSEIAWYVVEKNKILEVAPSQPTFNEAFFVSLDPLFSGKLNDIMDELTIESIGRGILRAVKGEFDIYGNSTISIGVFPVDHDGKMKARFRFIVVNNPISIAGKSSEFDVEMFNESYFEISYSSFSNFIHYDD